MATKLNTIRHLGGYTADAYTYYPILIIGAGESGIAMGCRLKQVLGFDQFRIVERRSGLGGTWYTNRYPGIACDIPAICYSYSWAQSADWSSLYPTGPEILDYLYQTCEKFQILDKIQLNTDVTSARWLAEQEEWEVTLAHMATGAGDLSSAERKRLAESGGAEKVVLVNEVVRAKIVVSAVGGLVEPKPYPEIPGLESFKGDILHTARWRDDISVRDKDVIVVGTGCSAAQVTPELVKPQYGAKSVTQLMRSPPWVQPGPTPAFTKWWGEWMPWLCRNIPGWQQLVRELMFTGIESEFLRLFANTGKARRARQEQGKTLIDYVYKTAPKEYHELVTPDYEVYCKRRVVDADWLTSLRDPRIDLTSLPLTSMQENNVTLGPGRYYPPMSKTDSKVSIEERTIPADVLVFANGYETNEWLHPLDLTGLNGRSLYDVWNSRGGAQAYMGTAMDGFPNFFMIFGPNTATGHSSVILASENMVNYSLKFIKGILSGDVRTYEVKEEAEREWTERIQRELKTSVWMSGGCQSWYKKNGWNATVYPRSQIDFSLRCMFPRWDHWNVVYTHRGLIKHRLRRTLQALAILGAVAGLLYVVALGGVDFGKKIGDAVGVGRSTITFGFDMLRSVLEIGGVGVLGLSLLSQK